MHLVLDGCELRPFRSSDAGSLAVHANDRGVWQQLRDLFPHPYTRADADAFITHVSTTGVHRALAVVVDGAAVGGIGYTLQSDVERVSSEIGYWIGRAFWGRGLMTRIVQAFAPAVFERHSELRRLYALPFATNAASARVLEKAGFVLEGRLRQAVIKDGQVLDQLVYGRLRTE
jgi:[ribosomal protein S5]-alanine N-acetyltransferase